jgi:hypothetical protein
MERAGPPRYGPGMPDTPMPQPLTDAETERRLAERDVREARASGPDIPHEVVRAEMLKELAELRRKIEALTQE